MSRSFGRNDFLAAIFFATLLTLVFSATSNAGSIVLVNETFNRYRHFPDEKPDNDPVNFGVPLVAEGADSDLWLAARFETPDDDPIRKDVGVQKFGGGGNSTPVGRAGDDAGLVLRLDLTGLTNATLDFDWRTFLAETTDRFVVAYYEGDGLGTPNNTYDWFNDPALGGGVMDLDGGLSNSWYVNNWTELLRATAHNSFQHENFALPGGGVLYLAFWLDNGDKDFAKFDNIVVMADPAPPGDPNIPEPSSFVLLALGLALSAVRTRRRQD